MATEFIIADRGELGFFKKCTHCGHVVKCKSDTIRKIKSGKRKLQCTHCHHEGEITKIM